MDMCDGDREKARCQTENVKREMMARRDIIILETKMLLLILDYSAVELSRMVPLDIP